MKSCSAGFVLAEWRHEIPPGVHDAGAGDMIYLYTDGVTEATDTGNQLYGKNAF